MIQARMAGALILAGLVASTPALAASSEWMKPSEAKRFVRALEGGDALFGIQCKDSGKPGKVNDMTLVKLTYGPNKQALLDWSWGVGDKRFFKKTDAARVADGYKRVSYSAFTRASSGFTVQCAVWHK